MKNDHVVITNTGFKCTRCGDKYEIVPGLKVTEYFMKAKSFQKMHQKCESKNLRIDEQ